MEFENLNGVPPSGRRRRAGRRSRGLRSLGIASTAFALVAAGVACGSEAPPPEGPMPTGTPIKVMAQQPVNTNLPAYPAGLEVAEIYAQWINAKGGIKGHPLEVITCDDRGDPNEAANCARTAVAEGVTAVVGPFSWDAGRAIGILEEAKIPWFGVCCPVVEQEFTSPVSYVTGSLFSFPAAEAWKAAQDGCTAPAAIQMDIAVKDLFFQQMRNGFAAAGFDPARAKYISLPPEPQDYSAQVAQATDGTDCIIGSMSEDNWAAFLPAFRAAGGTQRFYGPQGQLNAKIAEQFPDVTENAVVVNAYPNIEGPMWEDYRGALEAYDASDDLDWNSLVSLGTWGAMTAFTQIAEQLDGFSGAEFSAALDRTTSLETGGKMPPIDFTTTYDGLDGKYPRIFNRTVTFDVIRDGRPVPLDGRFHDMSKVMEGAPR